MDPEMALNITVETEECESELENDEQLMSSYTILEKVH